MRSTRDDRHTIGRLLTWIGGIAAALLTLPVIMGGCIALQLAAPGADPSSQELLRCRDQQCVEGWWLGAAACAAIVAVVVVLLSLVVRSSRRSLAAAALLSLAAAGVFAALAIHALLQEWVVTPFLLVAASATALGLGSALRLGAGVRRP